MGVLGAIQKLLFDLETGKASFADMHALIFVLGVSRGLGSVPGGIKISEKHSSDCG